MLSYQSFFFEWIIRHCTLSVEYAVTHFASDLYWFDYVPLVLESDIADRVCIRRGMSSLEIGIFASACTHIFFFFHRQLDLLIRIKISWTLSFDWFMKCLICSAPTHKHSSTCINLVSVKSSLQSFSGEKFPICVDLWWHIFVSISNDPFDETCEKLIMRIFAIAPLFLFYFGARVLMKVTDPF